MCTNVNTWAPIKIIDVTIHRRQIIIETNGDSVDRLVFATRPEWINFLFLEPFSYFRHWNFRR